MANNFKRNTEKERAGTVTHRELFKRPGSAHVRKLNKKEIKLDVEIKRLNLDFLIQTDEFIKARKRDWITITKIKRDFPNCRQVTEVRRKKTKKGIICIFLWN